jgi:hypothetical protein
MRLCRKCIDVLLGNALLAGGVAAGAQQGSQSTSAASAGANLDFSTVPYGAAYYHE